jgi:predicted dehydrogenase
MLDIGVIGYRNHAARMIKLIGEADGARVARIYHPDKALDAPTATRRIEDLLNLDAILILSPNDTHYSYLKFLSEHFSGYVFCEKPPVSTLSELDALDLDHSRFFFNFNYRFSRLKEVLQSAMNDGRLGQPIHMHVSMTQGLAYKSEYVGSWRSNSDRHKHGIAETKAIHYIDLASVLFGDLVGHAYTPASFAGQGGAFDTCHFSLRYDSGVIATLLMSYAAPLTGQATVVGTNGVVEYRDSAIRIYSPRDTFDERGYFAKPPCAYSYEYDDTGPDMYEESLDRSLAFFLRHCSEGCAIPDWHFQKSLAVNRFILELTE